MSLFDRRVIFVLGKGGVGKTTIASALGLAAEKMGKKVLLIEVGDADSIGPLFKKGTLPQYPEQILPNIWGARINPRKVIEDYIYVEIGFTFVTNRITRSKLFDHIASAAPGLKEVMTLGQIWRWERELNEKGDPNYDIIIVDAPATGHGLSMLRVLQTVIDMVAFGPIAEQSKVVLNLLKDQNKTWLTLVTLPEELPVNEAIEFRNVAETELKMPVNVTFINSVYPDIFTMEEQNQVDNIVKGYCSAKDKILCQTIIESARIEIIRRRLQESYINEIKTGARGFIMEIPFFFTNDLIQKNINDIANLILENKKIGL